ncbi:MAG TPA: ATP-dependent Clp protease proteolytic subunit [Euzebyales bacterium]|nr:ATP-dependent Clp protease proteolytic subunit [Euzebyales bacterium]
MRSGDIPPEIPAPGPQVPRPDAPTGPPVVPAAPPVIEDGAFDPRGALLRQRRVMLSGALDDEAATRVATELMLLDGESTRPVELLVNSDGGPLPALPAVLDVLDLMRAPVATRCIGRAMGTAAVVLASGTGGRVATANALISLRLRERYEVIGRSWEIERFAGELDHVAARIVAHLCRVTGLDQARARRELAEGAPWAASDALAHGMVDEVAVP